MPLGIWNLEFLNANSQRHYPLTDDSSGMDTTGSLKLPDNFLVELDLPIHAGLDVDPSRFFVLNVGVYATGFTVIVGYQPASGAAVAVASALIPRDGFAANNVYVLGGMNDYADTVGKLVIGKIDGLDDQPSGFFTFSLTTARLDPDCVRPLLRGVSSVIVSSGGERSAPMYGDIELVAEENMQLIPVVVAGANPQIRFSAVKGEGLAEPCVCDGDDGPCIKRINGIAPTASGDFTLLGNACLTVTGIANGLKLADVCSQPCCGCKELESITRDLERFGSQATTLANFLNRLESQVTEMNMVVLGSKLNDRGCTQCS